MFIYVCYLIQFDSLNKILRNYDYFYIISKTWNKIITFVMLNNKNNFKLNYICKIKY